MGRKVCIRVLCHMSFMMTPILTCHNNFQMSEGMKDHSKEPSPHVAFKLVFAPKGIWKKTLYLNEFEKAYISKRKLREARHWRMWEIHVSTSITLHHSRCKQPFSPSNTFEESYYYYYYCGQHLTKVRTTANGNVLPPMLTTMKE